MCACERYDAFHIDVTFRRIEKDLAHDRAVTVDNKIVKQDPDYQHQEKRNTDQNL